IHERREVERQGDCAHRPRLLPFHCHEEAQRGEENADDEADAKPRREDVSDAHRGHWTAQVSLDGRDVQGNDWRAEARVATQARGPRRPQPRVRPHLYAACAAARLGGWSGTIPLSLYRIATSRPS